MKKYLKWFFIIIVILLVISCSKQGIREIAKNRVKEHVLENGLQVVVVEKHGTPAVSIVIAYKVGGNYETIEQKAVRRSKYFTLVMSGIPPEKARIFRDWTWPKVKMICLGEAHPIR